MPTHPGDLAVALVALDAVLTLENAKGKQRRVPLAELLFVARQYAPEGNRAGTRRTDCGPHRARRRPRPATPIYLKVRERASYAYALASAAVGLDVQGGKFARRAWRWAA